jgi:TPR repeat protein
MRLGIWIIAAAMRDFASGDANGRELAMRLKSLLIGLAVLGATGAAAFAPEGSMPDMARAHYERQNCHGAYDVLIEQLKAGTAISGADTAWAESYEANAANSQPCPAPGEELARRATNRTVVTDLGLQKTAMYRDNAKDPAASFELAYAVLTDKTTTLTPQQGFGLLFEAVEKGEPAAQYFLALLHIGGVMGKPDDYATGFPLIEKAAQSGHVDALFMLANMYSGGLGTKKDAKKSFAYYSQAAERGHIYATYIAAYNANTGEGGAKKDHDLAYRLARNLAEQGEVVGAVLAASALLQQKNKRENEDEVLYWMDVALRDGDDKIKAEVGKFRPQVVALYERLNAPPEYQPRAFKACPMKRTCIVNHYSGLQSCTTNKDYWNDCDG